MIKGVNKNIIEIANTGSEYFDRAILFVNSEHSKSAAANLKRQAGLYLDSVGQTAVNKKYSRQEIVKMRKTKNRIRAVCALLIAGALILGTYLIAQMI